MNSSELRVSAAGLHAEAGWCESVAGKLAGNSAPHSAGLTPLGSATAVTGTHAETAAAGIRCSIHTPTTATKLATAATSYTANEASSATQMQTLYTKTVA